MISPAAPTRRLIAAIIVTVVAVCAFAGAATADTGGETGTTIERPSPYAVEVPGAPNPGVADWVAYFQERASRSQAQARVDLAGADALTRISTNWAEAKLRASQPLAVPELGELPQLPTFQLDTSLGVYRNVNTKTLQARFGATINPVTAYDIPSAAELLPSAADQAAFMNGNRKVQCSIIDDGACALAVSGSVLAQVEVMAAANPFYQAVQRGYTGSVDQAAQIAELADQIGKINSIDMTDPINEFDTAASTTSVDQDALRDIIATNDDDGEFNDAGIYDGSAEMAGLLSLVNSPGDTADIFSMYATAVLNPGSQTNTDGGMPHTAASLAERMRGDLAASMGRELTADEVAALDKLTALDESSQSYAFGQSLAEATLEAGDMRNSKNADAQQLLDRSIGNQRLTQLEVDNALAAARAGGASDDTVWVAAVDSLKPPMIDTNVYQTIQLLATSSDGGSQRTLNRLRSVYGSDRVSAAIAAGVADGAAQNSATVIADAMAYQPGMTTPQQVADGLLAAAFSMPAAAGGSDATSYSLGLRELGIGMGTSYLLEQLSTPTSPALDVVGPYQRAVALMRPTDRR